MSELKENAKNFLGAGKELGKSLLKEGQKVFDKHVKPAVENVSDEVNRQKVLKKNQRRKRPNCKTGQV